MVYRIETDGPYKTMMRIYAVFCILLIGFATVAIITVLRSPDLGDASYSGKAFLFPVVKSNEQMILEDISSKNFSKTIDLFNGHCKVKAENDCVFFTCYETGIIVNTTFEGFYYTPLNEPSAVAGVSPPWSRYFAVEDGNLRQYLEPQGGGWVWNESAINQAGNNLYYTEEICETLWYYKLVY